MKLQKQVSLALATASGLGRLAVLALAGRGDLFFGVSVDGKVKVSTSDLSELAQQRLVVSGQELDEILAARVGVVLGHDTRQFLEDGRTSANVGVRKGHRSSHLGLLHRHDEHDLLRGLLSLLVGGKVGIDAELGLVQSILDSDNGVRSLGLRVSVVLVQVGNNLGTLLGDGFLAFGGAELEFALFDDRGTNVLQIRVAEGGTG